MFPPPVDECRSYQYGAYTADIEQQGGIPIVIMSECFENCIEGHIVTERKEIDTEEDKEEAKGDYDSTLHQPIPPFLSNEAIPEKNHE